MIPKVMPEMILGQKFMSQAKNHQKKLDWQKSAEQILKKGWGKHENIKAV